MLDLDYIKKRLEREGCEIALNHLNQASSALERREWESASAQIRSAVEAVFDDIARIRLSSSKSGGGARKALQDSGILSDKQGKLIQSFVDYAGCGGSHAGRSQADEAQGRYMAALGLIMVGLNLLPELVRVQDVLSAISSVINDDQWTTSCCTCRTKQALSECEIRRDGEDTIYVCKQGCQPLVVISKPGDSPWPGRGYRIGDYVIRNASELRHAPTNSPRVLIITASPAALMKSKPQDS